MPFNTFSIHELVAVVLTYGLAVLFYTVYWTRGRKGQDLLFANLVAATAGICLAIFLADNVVVVGASGRGPVETSGSAEETLEWIQLMYTFALIALVCMLHFVLRYSRSRNRLASHIGWAYVVTAVVIPLVWSSWFARARSDAALAQGVPISWMNCFPFMPDLRPLGVGVFLLLWLAVHVYCQIVLWRYEASGRCPEEATTRLGLIRLALVTMAGGVLIDVVAVAFLDYRGLSFIPFFSVLMSGFVGGALLKDHSDAKQARRGARVAAW